MSSSEEAPLRSTPTTPLYQTDETLRTYLTRVTAYRLFDELPSAERDLFKAVAADRADNGQCFVVETKETIFYPQGGGQPFDTGVMSTAGVSKFKVEAVRNSADGRALHFGTWEDNSTSHAMAAGDMIEQHIDGARRDLNSRNHTAGHVVSLAVRRMVEQGADLDVIDQKASHIPGGCYVEFKGLIDGSFKDAIQSQTNEFVKQALPVKLYWHTPEELPGKDIIISDGMPVVSGHDGLVRVVDIVGAGAYPCGGTHVPDTSACGEINISRIKRQKGMSKVSYTIS
jgi:Ser-tRNA(Ala) deacylase AlaX